MHAQTCVTSAPWPKRHGGQQVIVLVLVVVIVVVSGAYHYTLAEVTALIGAAATAVAVRSRR